MDDGSENKSGAGWSHAVAQAHAQLARMDRLLKAVSHQIAAARELLDQSNALLDDAKMVELGFFPPGVIPRDPEASPRQKPHSPAG